ncbi:hypothetical protein JW758_06225 [Candidatus Peregrinibacteria bacterium]|nr:hypothetical protein [Candidatus Peregrinibacteria bacterium]
MNGSWRHYLTKQWRYLWAPIFNAGKIAKSLIKEEIDVLCLAEVDTGSIRNRFFSQVKKISFLLNMPYFTSAPKYHPKSFFKFIPLLRKHHDAIVSRLDGKNVKHYLSFGTKKLMQEFIVNNISIFTVHLSLLSKNIRKKQLKEIGEIMNKCPRSHILCGDFNIFYGLDEVKSFIKETGMQLVDLPASFPSYKPNRHLDLFFVSPDINIKKSGVIRTESSDHLPVWIEIKD